MNPLPKSHPFLLFAKGMAMGAADVVPGVSGGTIAFLTGIYDELISSVSNLNHKLIGVLFRHGIRSFWVASNAKFLVPLLAGIAVSIISLAALLTRAIQTHPIWVWSFFFGLVLASIPLISREIKGFLSVRILACFIGGAAVAFLISRSAPASGSDGLFYLFLSGAVAICAMILPGISGSFILLLLGSYATVLGSISDLVSGLKSMDMLLIKGGFTVVVVFALGCLTGIISFSKLLKWLLARHRYPTLGVLSGFLLGSLVKLWPWRIPLETFVKHEGTPKEKVIVLTERLVLPGDFPGDAHMTPALILFVCGAMVIWSLYRLSAGRAA